MRIFLDDIRQPSYLGWTGLDTVHVKDFKEFKEILLKCRDQIEVISFDHDLGIGPDGADCINWLEEQIYFGNIKCPKVMMVHSDNGPGRTKLELAIKTIYRRQKE